MHCYKDKMSILGHDNEFFIRIDANGATMNVQTVENALTVEDDEFSDLFKGWHKHCFTHAAGGSQKVGQR